MNKHIVASAIALAGILVSSHAQILFNTSFESGETPPYTTGTIVGQNSWAYTPGRTDRLQSDRITVNDSTTIGALSINQRNLFIDANRVGDGSNSRAYRMDKPLSFSIPANTNNPVTYYSFTTAVGDSGSDDRSEVFFAITNGPDALFGGTFIALKAGSTANPNDNNGLEIYGTGTGTNLFTPAPLIAQETVYTVTLATIQTGGLITGVSGWLNPTLVDGVPTGGADVNLDLSAAPVTPSSFLNIRAQNMPTAITNMTVAVPEPSTYAMLAGLLALTYVVRRRRR